MKKILLLILLFISLLFPLNIFALSDNYIDKVSSITETEVNDKKINIYLFKGDGCPHCKEEEQWLESIKQEYDEYINIYKFEVWYNDTNAKMLDEVKKEFGSHSTSIPFTVIGEYYYTGFSDVTASEIENKIKEYAELEHNSSIKLPILGEVDSKKVSLPVVAIILGFIDGFNPCAMWILLFLINMLFSLKNSKKRWLLGYTFLFVSGLVYFLSMLGINFVLSVLAVNWLKIILAIFILIAGILNLKKYLKSRKEEAGCSVVDHKKRKKLITKIRKIIDSKSFILACVGVIVLAISVNLIELACSLGFPMIFSELLNLNDISGGLKLIYLLIYIFFYMIDDLFVFTISMITLQATGITNKYNKLCTLISSIIMFIMGLLLLFKPEWLMLNF